MIKDQNPPKAARTRRGKAPSDYELKVDNTTRLINKLTFEWTSPRNKKKTVDFTQFEAYCEPTYIHKLVTKFEQSGWRESTKCKHFETVKMVLKYTYDRINKDQKTKTKIEFSADACKSYLMDDYRSIVTTGVGFSGNKKSLKTLGHSVSNLNSLLKKFGEKKIPKGAVPLHTLHTERLVSKNYSDKEWIAIIRTLHADRKNWMAKLVEEGHNVKENTFNKVVSNAFFMMVYYTAASQSELFSAVVEKEVEYGKLSGNRCTITGIKNRAGGKEIAYDITPRKRCKAFLESYLPLTKAYCEALGIKEHQLFTRFDGSAVNTGNLSRYVDYLYKNFPLLNVCKEGGRNFSLNCERLKSTVKCRTREAKGYANGVIAGRHTEGVHQQNNYSKTNREDAKKELALGVMTLETHARSGNGDISISINTAKESLGIKVYSTKEYDALKKENDVEHLNNGGTCQNKDTPQKRLFLKELDKNITLDEEDKKLMGCGYVVKCFMCSNFGVVDVITDIWKLLSFEKRLNESIEQHKSLGHFINNFGDLKIQIKDLKSRLNPKRLKQAVKRLETEIHPLWDDEQAVDDILRRMDV